MQNSVLIVVLQKLQALLFHPTDDTPLVAEVVPSAQVLCHTTVLPGKPWDVLLSAQHSPACCSFLTSHSAEVFIQLLHKHEQFMCICSCMSYIFLSRLIYGCWALQNEVEEMMRGLSHLSSSLPGHARDLALPTVCSPTRCGNPHSSPSHAELHRLRAQVAMLQVRRHFRPGHACQAVDCHLSAVLSHVFWPAHLQRW